MLQNIKGQLVHYFNYNIRYLEEVNPEEAYESNLASNPPTCASISFKEMRNGNFCSSSIFNLHYIKLL